MGTPEMDEAKHKAAKTGGSWNLPTIDGTFGWLRKWNWMATLFALVSIGIAMPKYIDDKAMPDAGKISVIWLPLVMLGTIGLNAIKEFYERERERKDKAKTERLLAELAALQAIVDQK